MTFFTLQTPGANATRKSARGLCVTPRCTRPAKAGRFCYTCTDRKRRAKNPERRLFADLRSSAKKRGIPFLLTFAEFAAFCSANNYVERVGRHPGCLTVDRREPAGPYSADNIRALDHLENSTLGGPLAGTGHRARYTPEEDPLA